jgi:phosphoglycolate phosphatase-like HAD superfamily hydrolase
MTSRFPDGVLFDYGGTLVEELSFDARAGTEWLFARAAKCPAGVTFEQVLERSRRVTQLVADRRAQHHVETPWPALTRLTYDFLGIELVGSLPELELGFWKAAVATRSMPGAQAMLARLHAGNVRLGVVSNACFSADVIRYELAKHGLTEHLRCASPTLCCSTPPWPGSARSRKRPGSSAIASTPTWPGRTPPA